MAFAERFADEGWLRIDGLFDVALIDAVATEYRRQFDELTSSDGHRGYIRVGDERMMLSIKLRGPLLDPGLYANPLLFALLEQFLGDDILIDSFTCVTAMPGAGEQRLHSDHSALFPGQPEIGPMLDPYAITVAVPLIDLTAETGSTRLFPRTHRGEEPGEPELPLVPRGSCFLLDYRLSHQGIGNASAGQRPMLFIVYARPWFTDTRNFRRQPRINIDRDALASVPERHWPLFRRLAAKGAFDVSEKELFKPADA